MRTVIAALALVAASAGAHAAALPPLEYDHPYKGKLDVIVVETAKEVRDACYLVKWTPEFPAIACSIVNSDHCTIIRRAEDYIKSRGYTLDTVMRHEIGHCNGWP